MGDVYYEKLEAVYNEYARCFDLEVALDIVPLTPEEREQLVNDGELTARIRVLEARKKQELMEALSTLAAEAESEGVRLSAIRDFGRMIYPKRFKEQGVPLTEKPGRLIWQEVAAEPA